MGNNELITLLGLNVFLKHHCLNLNVSSVICIFSVHGEGSVGDLRIVVFSSECLGLLPLVISLVSAPCKYKSPFIIISDNQLNR